ncbi:ribosomal-processing cysteine protease Prp [Lactobacillus sp. CBA3605]|uniref:ribosomal-processing cysteine protease Prp n=1 Tax=Lactobacillus sp. CBA3605 TaxID=2099788 RepID=UPI000CFCE1AC|nr:ribosomal-processing cysteine protease Prp [Lactobacillus sp. CBA3605]AVK60540.1 ribosomal-processing cysteine protease Prp [Lactobacillus sp. CBA3605]
MIKAKFQYKQNQIVSYQITGHAMHALKGYDIVCAAVSVMSTVITNELTEATVSDDGGLFVGLIVPSQKNAVLCNALLHGLQQVSDQHPENLQVIINV